METPMGKRETPLGSCVATPVPPDHAAALSEQGDQLAVVVARDEGRLAGHEAPLIASAMVL
jgi:hypothetical protein